MQTGGQKKSALVQMHFKQIGYLKQLLTMAPECQTKLNNSLIRQMVIISVQVDEGSSVLSVVFATSYLESDAPIGYLNTITLIWPTFGYETLYIFNLVPCS